MPIFWVNLSFNCCMHSMVQNMSALLLSYKCFYNNMIIYRKSKMFQDQKWHRPNFTKLWEYMNLFMIFLKKSIFKHIFSVYSEGVDVDRQ